MTVARRLFAIGCWVLIAMSLAHLVGHYGLLTSAGDDDTHRQLLSLMRGYTRDFGLGFVRSTFDILAGFSLAFAILPAGMGLVGLALARHGGGVPALLRQAAIVFAGVFGIMTAVAWRYWFPAPLAFLAAAFACFLGAVIAGS